MVRILDTRGLRIQYEDGELVPEGSLRHVATPFIKQINERLGEEKPALVREDDVVMSTWLPPLPSGPFRRLLMGELRMATGTRVPQTMSIEITRECGCNCEHCVVSEGDYTLTTGEIKRVIDDAIKMGAIVITFTEGDPLLHPDIIELVDYVDKEKAIVNLFTPGLELTPGMAEDLRDAGLHNLLVSLYSTDPEHHNQVRQLEGAHEAALRAIRRGLDAGLLVTMATHISPGTMHELPRLYAFARALGVHEFSVWESVPKEPGDPLLSNDDRERILDMYHRINSTEGGPRMFANTHFEGEMLGCMAGRRWAHVTVGGEVKPCPYMPFSIGNIREEELSKIWRQAGKYDEFTGEYMGCMMQDPEFLEKLERIPEEASKPYPYDRL